MSVTLARGIYVVPFLRDDKPGSPFNRAHIGRWHGCATLAGDATGGYYSATFSFANPSGVFGSQALWDIKVVGAYEINGGLANAYGFAYIYSYERSSSTPFRFPLSGVSGINVNGSGAAIQFWNIPDFKMAFSQSSGTNSQVQIVVYPNTNTTTMIFSIAGNIYDQRYL